MRQKNYECIGPRSAWSMIADRQVLRIKNNVVPFILLGFICGVIVLNADSLNGNSLFAKYWRYAGITRDSLLNNAMNLFAEQFAPNTLTVLLYFVLMISSLHRAIYGATYKDSWISKRIILPLEGFASSLAIAWLGIMLGMLVPAFYESWLSGLKFAFLIIFPLMYLAEITLFIFLTSWDGISKRPVFDVDMHGWLFRTRVGGFMIFILAIIVITYQDAINDLILKTGAVVVGYLFH